MRLVELLRRERDARVDHSLYWWTQVMFAYNSNHMEGTRLTEGQTEQLYETGSVFAQAGEPVRQDDLVETSNHFHAFSWILDHADEPVTGEMACRLQGMLKHGTGFERLYPDQTGSYKHRVNVIMGGLATDPVRTAPPDDVPAFMSDVCREMNGAGDDPVRLAGAHWMFEKTHPFLDGNGRVGRLLLFKQCLRLDTVPPLVLDQERGVYYRALARFPDEPGYLVDCLLHARDVYRDMIRQLVPDGPKIRYNDKWDARSADVGRYRAFAEEIARAVRRTGQPEGSIRFPSSRGRRPGLSR